MQITFQAVGALEEKTWCGKIYKGQKDFMVNFLTSLLLPTSSLKIIKDGL